MFEWQSFPSVFQVRPDYFLDHKQVEAINRHRKELGGILFFDRVWNSVGLKQASKSYPPKSNNDLKNLWVKVVASPAPDHQKHAILYYILKDCRHLNNADVTFANQVYLPRRYQLLVTGLWELDHCQFSRALEHLTEPSLTPTFADEILLVLLQHPKCDNSLAMAYYITVSPPLQNPTTLEAYFTLLCQTNIVEAYRFSQRQDEAKHRTLFENLIVILHSEFVGENRADRALTLLGLPYSHEEEEWFESCLLHGSASKCSGAKDSVIMRRIATGKAFEGVGTFDRQSGPKIHGVNWDDIRLSMQKTTAKESTQFLRDTNGSRP